MNTKTLAIIRDRETIEKFWLDYGSAPASVILDIFKISSLVTFEYFKPFDPTIYKETYIVNGYYQQVFEDHFELVKDSEVDSNAKLMPRLYSSFGKVTSLFEPIQKAANLDYNGFIDAQIVISQVVESISKTALREFDYAVGL